MDEPGLKVVQAGRAGLWMAAVPLAGIGLFRIGAAWATSPRGLVTLTPDDAYYYFGVARNLGRGLGSTFDGVTHTNGYQPLWLWLLAGLARVLPGDLFSLDRAWLLPRAGLTLQILSGLLGLWLIGRALEVAANQRAARLFLVAACNPFTVYSLANGMESGMVLLALGFLTAWFVDFAPAAPPKAVWLGGALLLLAALARLDLGLLTPLTVLVLWQVAGARKALQLSAIPLLGLSIYAAVDWSVFGLALPVSMTAKSSFPHPVFSLSDLFENDNLPSFALSLIGAGLAWRLRSRAEVAPGLRALLLVAAVFMPIQAIMSALFVRFGLTKWHFTAANTFGLLTLALTASLARERRWFRATAVPAAATFVAVAATFQLVLIHRYLGHTFQNGFYDTAIGLRERLNPKAIIGVADAGIIGYVLGGRVIDLDGLVADRNYQEVVRQEGLLAYARQVGMGYIAVRFPPECSTDEEWVYELERVAYGVHPGEIPLDPQKLFYRGPLYTTYRGPEFIAVYAL